MSAFVKIRPALGSSAFLYAFAFFLQDLTGSYVKRSNWNTVSASIIARTILDTPHPKTFLGSRFRPRVNPLLCDCGKAQGSKPFVEEG